HLAWFCVTCGKLPLFGSPRLLALGISGLISVLTLGNRLDSDDAGRRRAGHAVRQFTHGQFFRSDASAHPRPETGASGPRVFPRPWSDSPGRRSTSWI